jgi:hypothetical protein
MEILLALANSFYACAAPRALVEAQGSVARRACPLALAHALMDRKVLNTNTSCHEVVGGAVVSAKNSGAVVVAPSYITLTLAVDTSAMLRAFDAVLFFRVGVCVARGAWTSSGQAIGSIPPNLTSALRHLTHAMPSTVVLASVWRECPDTLGQNRMKHRLESLFLAI